MSNDDINRSFPEFVFVCGAVGSGNSFMFGCLTRDERVYGINEDDFGETLRALINSQKEVGTCPHADSAFVDFMHALRHDRQTLILKTPCNIRHTQILNKYLPKSQFLFMIREPHTAIVSGIKRHGPNYSIGQIGRIWLEDCLFHTTLPDGSLRVTFDDLVTDPNSTLRYISNNLLPLSPAVFKYATRISRPERSRGEWWRSMVDEGVQKEIGRCVEELKLSELYRSVQGAIKNPYRPRVNRYSGFDAHRLRSPLITAKKQFFRAWYRLVK